MDIKIILMIACIFMITACNTENVIVPDDRCSLVDEPEKEECYISLAKETADESYCENIEHNRTSSFCYKEVALVKEDFNVCDTLFDKDIFWYNQCYEELARKTDIVDYCYNIADNMDKKDECIKDIAVKNKNLDACDSISYLGDNSGCVYEIAKELEDASLCNFTRVDLKKDTCYARMAKNLMNKQICNKIDLTEVRLQCLSSISNKIESEDQ